jgi:redox-sensitive bicupin YhaK (pirin superfamily)
VLRLWVALARADKDHPPTAEQIPPDQVPVTHAEGVTRRVVLGPGAPLSLHTEVGWLDLAFTKRRVRHSEPIPAEHRGLVYLLDGTLEAQGIRLAPADALLFEHLDSLELRARKGARAALIHGRPHREPIRPWGLVVD